MKAAGIEITTPTADAMAGFAKTGQVGWDRLTPIYGEARIAELKKEVAAVRGQ